MSRSHRIVFSALAGLVLCLSSAFIASADPLVLTLQTPHQFALPGQTITFFATVTNSDMVNANPATITDRSFAALQLCQGACNVNNALFIANFDNQVVAVGAPLGPLPIFTVIVDNSALLGAVAEGNIFLEYNGQFFTNIESWSLTVGTAPEPVPEPATMILLATGLAGALGSKRVRRRFTKR